MRQRPYVVLLALSALFAADIAVWAQQPAQRTIKREERDMVGDMLRNIHEALKANYYDPSFHGLNVDMRYKEYNDRIKKAETLGGALRVVAAYLSGLNDSHTVFVPPARDNVADYGFRMQMVGEACYVTDVRPGSDAEQKIHPGDRIVSLDGYAVGRIDLSQLGYYLREIATKPITEMTVRSPAGETRKVLISTKYTKLEDEKAPHPRRQRFVERGDVLFWKLPTFLVEETEVDRIISVARTHKTLILDLRGNAGGHVSTLSRLVSSVMDHDVTLGTRVMRNGQKAEVAKSRPKNLFPGNLIVLVDSASASAAEVFARLVQLEHRGTVVGDRSSGSVMESLFHPFK